MNQIVRALVAGLALTGTAQADGDPAAGEKVFRQCQACHMVGPKATNRVGPPLNGVVGSEIAAHNDFKYSDAFIAKKEEGVTWTEATLTEYLANPMKVIQGTKMAYVGLRKEQDIADVIAYLATFE